MIRIRGNLFNCSYHQLSPLFRTLSLEETRRSVGGLIDEYIKENITLAAKQISITGCKKIQDGKILISTGTLINKRF